MGDLVDKASIPTGEPEVVPKSFDDASLRPPDVAVGERPCCLNERCICVWMARWRYGIVLLPVAAIVASVPWVLVRSMSAELEKE